MTTLIMRSGVCDGEGSLPALRLYSDEDDDIPSVLHDLAEGWAAAGASVRLDFPGAPLTSPIDLTLFLEQAPALAAALDAGRPFTASMYEQTAMFDVHFDPNGAIVHVHVEPWTGPRGAARDFDRAALVGELRAVITSVRLAVARSGNLRAARWEKEWREGTVVP